MDRNVPAPQIGRYRAAIHALSRLAVTGLLCLGVGALAAPGTAARAGSASDLDGSHHSRQAARHPIALGVFTPNAPDPGEVTRYARLVGAKPAIVMWYSEFDTPLFTAAQLRDIRSLHTTPLISWRPVVNNHQAVQFSDIAAGKDDAYLERQAARARAAHRLIFIRWAYEMNLSGQDYGSHVAGETPSTYVAAWRHIVTVFREAGATNVRWVWSPNTDCAGRCPFTAYFPGNGYVDWLGLDGYNFASAHDAAWVSLHYIFASSYATITALSHKPVMFAEIASAQTPGNKAYWIRTGFTATIPQEFPRVRAAVWFDANKEADWRVNSSPQALRAWRRVVASRRYDGRPVASGKIVVARRPRH